MKQAIVVPASVILCLGLLGCPYLQRTAMITVHNAGSNADIIEIRVKGPGDTDFGENLLSFELASGAKKELKVDAPLRFEDEGGVAYTVRVVYELFELTIHDDEGIFECLHAGDVVNWTWSPNTSPTLCVD